VSAASEKQKVTRAAGVIGAATLASRLGGYLRDMTIAYFFGASAATDAFVVAFRIPNLLRRLFAEGSLTVAFIPVFTEVLRKDGQDEAVLVARSTYTVTAILLTVICGLGMVFTPELLRLIAPGFKPGQETFELAVHLARWCLPFIFFISLVALAGGVLNSLGHFFVPAVTPLVLNISIITCAVALSPRVDPPVLSLALGVLIGGVLQLLLQLPLLKHFGVALRPALALAHPALRRIGRLMVPAIFGAAVYQLAVVINTILASWLPSGSVSYLYYADRLIQFPLGIFAIAVGTAVLPSLSRQAADGDYPALIETMNYGLRVTLFICLPAMVGIMVLAEPLVLLLFARGEFDLATARQTAWAVFGYGFGLLGFSGVRAVVPAFYALKDTKTPVMVAAVSLVVMVGLSLVLIGPLAHIGLALATSVAGLTNLAGLLWLLRRKVGPLGMRSVALAALRMLAAVTAMGLAVAALAYLPDWGSVGSLGRRYARPLVAVVVGAGVYLGLARLLRISELRDLGGMVGRRRA